MYLSSGCLMDGAAFSAWQVEGSQTHYLLGRICLGRAAIIIQYETTSHTHTHTLHLYSHLLIPQLHYLQLLHDDIAGLKE